MANHIYAAHAPSGQPRGFVNPRSTRRDRPSAAFPSWIDLPLHSPSTGVADGRPPATLGRKWASYWPRGCSETKWILFNFVLGQSVSGNIGIPRGLIFAEMVALPSRHQKPAQRIFSLNREHVRELAVRSRQRRRAFRQRFLRLSAGSDDCEQERRRPNRNRRDERRK